MNVYILPITDQGQLILNMFAEYILMMVTRQSIIAWDQLYKQGTLLPNDKL